MSGPNKRVIHFTRLQRLTMDKHFSLSNPFISYGENEKLWIWHKFCNLMYLTDKHLHPGLPNDRISESCEKGSSAMFHSWPREKNETCADISSDPKHLILYFKKKMFCLECSSLSYFTIRCNDDEYKMMG